jgi:REP element-mobilizing transposase RayT
MARKYRGLCGRSLDVDQEERAAPFEVIVKVSIQTSAVVSRRGPCDRYLGLMSIRQFRQKEGAVYFATFTCHQWVPLFHALNAYDIVYNWMQIAHAKGYRFFGYAIMPNHAHFVIRAPEGGAINTLLGNGKRFMAYAIVQRLTTAGRLDILARLQEGLRPSDVARGQKHRVFATSTDMVELLSAKMIEQKLRCIHANPVSKKWRLADDAVEYPHSSFVFYVRGEARGAPLSPYQEFGYLGGKGAPW